MCADIRIATKGVIMSLPETSLAIIPGAGGTQRLPRIVGVPKAKELIFTGARLDAVEGHSIGLVNHIADDFQQAMELAMKIADQISKKGPVAIRAAKEAISKGSELQMADALKLEEMCYGKILVTEDRLEGLKAFAEKRQPVYKGK